MTSKKKPDQTVQSVKMATLEQIKQLIAIVVQAIPTRITFEQAEYWVGHAKELGAKIRAFFKVADPYAGLVAQWEEFYKALAIPGLSVDLSTLRVPTPKEGFTRLIVVIPGLKIEEVLAQCKKRFAVLRWTEEDLDAITKSTRCATTEPYAIWVRDIPDADPIHANKSYNALAQASVIGITLLEHLLYELKYFMETGKHLDVTNVTLCTGTLCSADRVSIVYWIGDGLGVSWCHRDRAHSELSVREVGGSVTP